MHVRLVQLASSADVSANVSAMADLAERAWEAAADDEQPRLTVFPEAAMHTFGSPRDPLGPAAQPVDGTFAAAITDIARETRSAVVAGMFETSADPDRPYNTLVAIGPGGDLVARYRKMHLYDAFGYRESDRLTAGPADESDVAVIPLGGLRLGLLTCYDLRFPELARLLVERGADVLVVPAAWVPGEGKVDHWTTLLRARAIENTAYALGAGQPAPTCIGVSTVVDPAGRVIAQLDGEQGILAAEIDAETVATVRRANPSLANRRAELAIRRPG